MYGFAKPSMEFTTFGEALLTPNRTGTARIPTPSEHEEPNQPISSDAYIANYLEEGDPLQNDRVLLQGIRIAEPGDDGPNTIRKVPSEQTLSTFRWGSNHRMTGRSRSGLQILVPGREMPATVVTEGTDSGKSIIYTYASSSDSSGKTTDSLGAIGGQLTTGRRSSLWDNKLLTVPEAPKRAYNPISAGRKPRSPLAELVADSKPDVEPYQILIKGEKGPCTKPIIPRIVSLKDFPRSPLRRRSLSDLIDEPRALLPPSSVDVSVPAVPHMSTATQTNRSYEPDTNGEEVLVQSPDRETSTEPLKAPIWRRSGPPFAQIQRRGAGAYTQDACLPEGFDPPTYYFPFDSKLFVMKSRDLHSLRASIVTGVWSSSKGANRVLQNAWESKAKDEKIVFLFSISHSGQYCGMAEMCGPFDPYVDPQCWISGLKGNEGIIPLRWIVAKDVDFSVFVDLKYKGKFVTELRHGNTVPGEAGRSLVKAYFEIEHPPSSILHPQGQDASTSISAPPKTPVKSRKLPARTMTPSGRQTFGTGLKSGMTPGWRSQPMYGMMGRGCWVRPARDVPPPPPSMNPIGLGNWSTPRAVAPQRRLQSHPGLQQSSTAYSSRQPIDGHSDGGEYGSSSDLQHTASSQAPSRPFPNQMPFNSTQRPVARPYVVHQSYGGAFLGQTFSARK